MMLQARRSPRGRIISSNMIRLAAKQDHQKDRASIVSKNAATGYWRSGRRSGKRLCGSRLAAILRDACSPDEATAFGRVIRGRPEFLERPAPDYASLHPGYRRPNDGST